eukprot:6202245-Pleurochrysis_carterae.AAC.1
MPATTAAPALSTILCCSFRRCACATASAADLPDARATSPTPSERVAADEVAAVTSRPPTAAAPPSTAAAEERLEPAGDADGVIDVGTAGSLADFVTADGGGGGADVGGAGMGG